MDPSIESNGAREGFVPSSDLTSPCIYMHALARERERESQREIACFGRPASYKGKKAHLDCRRRTSLDGVWNQVTNDERRASYNATTHPWLSISPDPLPSLQTRETIQPSLATTQCKPGRDCWWWGASIKKRSGSCLWLSLAIIRLWSHRPSSPLASIRHCHCHCHCSVACKDDVKYCRCQERSSALLRLRGRPGPVDEKFNTTGL